MEDGESKGPSARPGNHKRGLRSFQGAQGLNTLSQKPIPFSLPREDTGLECWVPVGQRQGCWRHRPDQANAGVVRWVDTSTGPRAWERRATRTLRVAVPMETAVYRRISPTACQLIQSRSCVQVKKQELCNTFPCPVQLGMGAPL